MPTIDDIIARQRAAEDRTLALGYDQAQKSGLSRQLNIQNVEHTAPVDKYSEDSNFIRTVRAGTQDLETGLRGLGAYGNELIGNTQDSLDSIEGAGKSAATRNVYAPVGGASLTSAKDIYDIGESVSTGIASSLPAMVGMMAGGIAGRLASKVGTSIGMRMFGAAATQLEKSVAKATAAKIAARGTTAGVLAGGSLPFIASAH